MQPEATIEEPPRLRAVHIREYKNLVDVSLPWSDGLAIFGANGSGKTNLLECLAIMLGTEQTLRLTQHRLKTPVADALSVDVEMPRSALPWPPSEVLGLDLTKYEDDLLAQLPTLFRAHKDALWWQAIGVARGDSFIGGLGDLGLPERAQDWLKDQVNRPALRYSLGRFKIDLAEGLDEIDDPPELTVSRRFSRTLLVSDPPGWLADLAPALPDVFAPFRTALAELAPGTAEFMPFMTLPDVLDPPAILEWLARPRTSRELNLHLWTAYREARRHAETFASEIAKLPVASTEFEPDVTWWLHGRAASTAQQELQITVPHIEVEPLGEDDADIDLKDRRIEPPKSIGRTGEYDVLEHFSAGERRWVDEALASAGRALRSLGETLAWQAALLDRVDEDELIAALAGVGGQVDVALRNEGSWSTTAIDLVIKSLDAALVRTAWQFLAEHASPLRRSLSEHSIAGLTTLQPSRTVRVFDEPEAHLHPAAQRSVARALDRLRLRGQDVVLASHSPHFLDLPGWQLIHAQHTPEGSTFSILRDSDLHAQHALAGQLGLTRGELLTRIGYVLIVEGEHDRLVLETLYRAELSENGVALLRMHGTHNLLATAEMDFVERHLDVPLGVLLDNARIDRVVSSRRTEDLSDEEQRLRALGQACRRRGRAIDFFGLTRPDITAYLSETVLLNRYPTFPGWRKVLDDFSRKTQRPSFKSWLLEHHGVDVTRTDRIRDILEEMKTTNASAASELTARVAEITNVAGKGRWPAPEDSQQDTVV